ncbi:MAG: nucleotidyltransferase domain-containing protein [Candidatus Geothermincolia bacterium]
MARRSIAPVLERFVRAVRAQGIVVDRVILYGSQASGRQRPESDIDVAIISRDFGKKGRADHPELHRLRETCGVEAGYLSWHRRLKGQLSNCSITRRLKNVATS